MLNSNDLATLSEIKAQLKTLILKKAFQFIEKNLSNFIAGIALDDSNNDTKISVFFDALYNECRAYVDCNDVEKFVENTVKQNESVKKNTLREESEFLKDNNTIAYMCNY